MIEQERKLYFYILEYNKTPSAKTEKEADWHWDISRMKPTIEEAKKSMLNDMYYTVLGRFGVPTDKKQKKEIRNVGLYSITAQLVEEGEPSDD